MAQDMDFRPHPAFQQIIECAEDVACGRRPRTELLQLLSDFVKNQSPIDEYVRYSDNGYFRNQIYASENFELVVCSRGEEQNSEPHDHGNSWGMVVPYKGTITNTLYKLISQNLVEEMSQVVQKPGDVIVLDTSDIHRVDGNCEDGPLCVSIHCYFPPITHMNEYQEVAGGVESMMNVYKTAQRI